MRPNEMTAGDVIRPTSPLHSEPAASEPAGFFTSVREHQVLDHVEADPAGEAPARVRQ